MDMLKGVLLGAVITITRQELTVNSNRTARPAEQPIEQGSRRSLLTKTLLRAAAGLLPSALLSNSRRRIPYPIRLPEGLQPPLLRQVPASLPLVLQEDLRRRQEAMLVRVRLHQEKVIAVAEATPLRPQTASVATITP
jgi:hypothetical protein